VKTERHEEIQVGRPHYCMTCHQQTYPMRNCVCPPKPARKPGKKLTVSELRALVGELADALRELKVGDVSLMKVEALLARAEEARKP
jgi:hypothetical protein